MTTPGSPDDSPVGSADGAETGGTGEHLSIRRFREELSRRGGTGRIVVLPD